MDGPDFMNIKAPSVAAPKTFSMTPYIRESLTLFPTEIGVDWEDWDEELFCLDNIEKKRVTGFQLKLEVQEIKRDKNFTIEICGGRGANPNGISHYQL